MRGENRGAEEVPKVDGIEPGLSNTGVLRLRSLGLGFGSREMLGKCQGSPVAG